jgi:hypothetical protein
MVELFLSRLSEGPPGSEVIATEPPRRRILGVYVYSLDCTCLQFGTQKRNGGGDYREHVGRKVDVDLLVDAREIAARLGFPRPQLVHYFVGADPTFPKPVWQAGPGRGGLRLWYWPEVERWAARTGKARHTATSKGRRAPR